MHTSTDGAARETVRRPWLALPLTLVVLAMVVAACGSDGGNDTPASTSNGSGEAPTSEPTETAESRETAAVPEASGVQPGREPLAGYVYAGSAKDAAKAKAAGEADAGEPVEAPTGKTIGVIQLSGQSATSKSITGTRFWTDP